MRSQCPLGALLKESDGRVNALVAWVGAEAHEGLQIKEKRRVSDAGGEQAWHRAHRHDSHNVAAFGIRRVLGHCFHARKESERTHSTTRHPVCGSVPHCVPLDIIPWIGWETLQKVEVQLDELLWPGQVCRGNTLDALAFHDHESFLVAHVTVHRTQRPRCSTAPTTTPTRRRSYLEHTGVAICQLCNQRLHQGPLHIRMLLTRTCTCAHVGHLKQQVCEVYALLRHPTPD